MQNIKRIKISIDCSKINHGYAKTSCLFQMWGNNGEYFETVETIAYNWHTISVVKKALMLSKCFYLYCEWIMQNIHYESIEYLPLMCSIRNGFYSAWGGYNEYHKLMRLFNFEYSITNKNNVEVWDIYLPKPTIIPQHKTIYKKIKSWLFKKK